MNTNRMNEYNGLLCSQCDVIVYTVIGQGFNGVGEYKCWNCRIQSRKVDEWNGLVCLKCETLFFVHKAGTMFFLFELWILNIDLINYFRSNKCEGCAESICNVSDFEGLMCAQCEQIFMVHFSGTVLQMKQYAKLNIDLCI